MRPAIRCIEFPVLAKPLPAPLNLITCLLELFNPRVHRHNAGDLVSDLLGTVELNQVPAFRNHTPGQIDKRLPFASGLTNSSTGDFRTEKYAAFGRSLSSSSRLFIAGSSR